MERSKRVFLRQRQAVASFLSNTPVMMLQDESSSGCICGVIFFELGFGFWSMSSYGNWSQLRLKSLVRLDTSGISQQSCDQTEWLASPRVCPCVSSRIVLKSVLLGQWPHDNFRQLTCWRKVIRAIIPFTLSDENKNRSNRWFRACIDVTCGWDP